MLVFSVGLLALRIARIKGFSSVETATSDLKCYHSLKLGEDTVCTDCMTFNTVPINGICVPDDPNICITLQGYNTKCGSCTSDYMLFEDGCYDLNGKYAPLICAVENRYVLGAPRIVRSVHIWIMCRSMAFVIVQIRSIPVPITCAPSAGFPPSCSMVVVSPRALVSESLSVQVL